MAPEETPPLQSPTSWRDVYQLVADAEKRLTRQITDGFGAQQKVSADHEVRLRVLEATDQKQSGQVSGGVAVFGAGRQILLTIGTIVSIVIAIAGFLKP